MQNNILVTGGAGYIGSHIVKDLCNIGYHVIVFDNLSTGRKENIDNRAKLIIGDILNEQDLKNAFRNQYLTVFHFAALKAAGESMQNPSKYAKNNIIGTINLINAMLAGNSNNMVFSSSAAVYGEPQYLPIDEKHAVDPTNYYGYTKLAIEQNLHWFSKLKGIRYAALRYFNATGYDVDGKIKGKEKNPANLSPIVMEVAAGIREKMHVFGDDYNSADGTCIRDYIHVNDLSTAHLATMDYLQKNQKNLVVNLGTGSGHSVLEVIKAAEDVTGKKVNFEITGRREGDPEKLIAGCELAAKLLNWKAEYSDLETIFKSMIPVYFQNK